MKTIYLGKEEVTGYARDIVQRLLNLPNGIPLVWCPIGKSGDQLARVIIKELLDLCKSRSEDAPNVLVVDLAYNKSTKTACLKDSANAPFIKEAEQVLVLDSSVHSGGSMLECIRLLAKLGAQNIISYSLVIKKNSRLIPHYFGLMVGDHDRVLFLLDILPNNRLFTGRRIPVGTVRRIESNDIHREQTALSTGVASLDKISWGDLLYEATANGYEVFLVEDSQKIAGFIKLKIKEGNTLSIDVIANDETYKGKGIGGALMRFAENYGRANECRYLDLWSIEDQKEFYLKYGYQVKGEVLDAGDGERYIPMRRTLLYHFSVEMDEQDHIPAAHA